MIFNAFFTIVTVLALWKIADWLRPWGALQPHTNMKTSQLIWTLSQQVRDNRQSNLLSRAADDVAVLETTISILRDRNDMQASIITSRLQPPWRNQ